MDLQLKEKRVLVTASSGGIGKEIAKQFLTEGAEVIIHGRSLDTLEYAVHELAFGNDKIKTVTGDMGTEEGIKSIIDAVSTLGGIDILVNNAGIYFNHEDWFAANANDWIKLYAINVVATVQLIQAVAPVMVHKGWGRIIQISSGEATQPFDFMPDYAATKAAMNNLTVSLSRALRKTGITVNTVSPGLIVTEGLKNFYHEYAINQNWGNNWTDIEQKIMENVLDNNTSRLGVPADVANLVCFISSPIAGYINGANFRIDGGSTISIN